MKPAWLVLTLTLLAGCNGDATEAEPRTESPSPPATVDDFHMEWCSIMQPYLRVIDELPTLARDADIVRTVRKTVEGLDSLRLQLEEADLAAAAAAVEALANAIHDQAEVLDSRAGDISANFMIQTLNDQAQVMKGVNRAVGPAVAQMGRC